MIEKLRAIQQMNDCTADMHAAIENLILQIAVQDAKDRNDYPEVARLLDGGSIAYSLLA